MRVAVASNDGKIINQHFGKATQFLIFDISKTANKFIELRKNEPICGTSEFAGHDEGRAEACIKKISDCKIVLCSRVGIGMRQELQAKGIEAIEAPFLIKSGLKKISGRIKIGKRLPVKKARKARR